MNSKGVDATAAFSSSTSASASSSTAASVYDVFLSFCGKDTRKHFTDYLYNDLIDANIKTFRDNNELEVGKKIGPELLKAIEDSKISIPIFSQNYASSKWCLRELEYIVKCYENGEHKIYPIFYDVVPSDVRNQRESYAEAFRLHGEKSNEDTIQSWRHALKVVGELKGLELKIEADGREGEFAKKIVKKIVKELKKNYMDLPQTDLVGMDNHIEELRRLLEVDSDDVRIVGIHGMGGLGKTTMAKVIYNQMCENFDGQCFLDNVREKSKYYDGIAEMQKQFISSIHKRGVSNFSDGRSSIKDIVRGKKLLLVLDDVDDYFQVDMLMGELIWFGAGSRIILTTRDKDVLDQVEFNCHSEDSYVVYRIYNPKFMDSGHSLQLFSKHAFKRDFPIEEYNILSKEVVSIAAGLPLVLVVLGSTFSVLRDKGLWEEKLRQLRKIPNKKVLEKLKFSFEALEDTEKEIFLDIACLFIGDNKTRPTYMWEDCGLYPKLGTNVLVSRSLITIDDDEFHMHDQLRDLGRQIVREEGLHGRQSRLWCSEEALRILEINQGISSVNALRLESHDSLVARHFHHLPNLRYLSMWNVTNVDGDFKDLLPNLRWLECMNMLGKFSLRNLNMKNLVVLNLSSNDGLTNDWDGWRLLKMANNLKVVDLSYCVRLQTLPNLSNLTMLVELNLKGCRKLIEIQGLQKLKFLQVLKIMKCTSLRRLPNISSLKDLKVFNARNCKKLIQIEGLSGLISLEYLHLRGCKSLKEGLGDLSNLNKLQVLQGAPGLDLTDFSRFKNLKQLEIYKSNRIEIQNLDGLEALEYLRIYHCSSIIRLPNLLYLKRLKTLMIEDCEQLIEIPNLDGLEALEGLLISLCSCIVRIPKLPYMKRLESLTIQDCEQLIEIQNLDGLEVLEDLQISVCSSIVRLPKLQYLKRLNTLTISDCEQLIEIQDLSELKSLEWLSIKGCNSVKALHDLSPLQKLKVLDVSGCAELSEIRGIEELKCLEELSIKGSKELQHLRDLPNVRIHRD